MSEMKTKIITLTLNPAYDVHCEIESFRPFHENYVKRAQTEAGGKGVNISRALTVNNIPNSAFIALGRQNSSAFEGALLKDGIRYSGIFHSGKIRENFVVHSENMEETRISFEGIIKDTDLMDQAEYLVLSDCDPDTILVFSGRVPRGIPIERVRSFLLAVKETGAKIVVDSNSFSLADYLAVKPWLIKPNQEEVTLFTGRSVDSIEMAEQVANDLHSSGIENVIVSMGMKGLCFANAEGHFSIPGIKLNPISTIGAGDSAIAGFLAGIYKGYSTRDAVKLAFAFGTAACLRSGTLPPLPANIKEIFDKL